MFPPRAESVDSFSHQPAIGQPESRNLTSESEKPAKSLSRRGLLAGVASAAALPIAAATVPMSAHPDADLVELGARFEPLVDRYYAARGRWARSLTAAHAERDQRFGTPEDNDYRYTSETNATIEDIYERLGYRMASDDLQAAYDVMEPVMKTINAAPVNSIEGLRAKALVALYEVAPLCADSDTFSFDDAYPFQQLFTAVADLCGLNEKLAATGHRMPDIEFDESDDGEEA
jgi:hypothetical protein